MPHLFIRLMIILVQLCLAIYYPVRIFFWDIISLRVKIFFSSQLYLHESRHRHAMKRVRGPGPFLNRKELQEQQGQKALPSLQTPTGGVGKMAFCRNLCPENSASHSPSTSSGTSSVSNGGGMVTHQEHISFSSSDFLPSMNFHAENGNEKIAVNGVRHCTPSWGELPQVVAVALPSLLAHSSVPVAIHPWLMKFVTIVCFQFSYGVELVSDELVYIRCD